MTVMAPADENECRQMLYTAFTLDTPAAVRYPRGAGPGVAIDAADDGAADRQGRDPPRGRSGGRDRIAILAFGAMLQPALAAAEDARCDGRQHALRQAARRRPRRRRWRASTTRSSRSRRTSSPAAPAAPWPRRSRRRASSCPMLASRACPDAFHRSRRSGAAARAVRARRDGHRGVDRRALRATPAPRPWAKPAA